MTHINENKGVLYLTYSIFEELEFIKHASSTRSGGVSKGELGGMNFGAATRDLKENIKRNYEIFCDAAGIDISSVVISSQFHNANIKVCEEEDKGAGVLYPLPYSDVDGLITDKKGVTLCIFSADCIPVLFADPENKAIGACHCGWKGTYKELAGLTVGRMKELYNTNPSVLKVVIAPGICMKCYEVSKELYFDFKEKFPYASDSECAVETDGKYYINLPLINKRILENSGVKSENIYISDLCTCCNPELLHSHRATNGKRGIMGHFIGVK